MYRIKHTKLIIVTTIFLLTIIGCSTININRKTSNYVEIKSKGKIEVSIQKNENEYQIKYRDANYEYVENYYIIHLSNENFYEFRNVLLKIDVSDDFVEYRYDNTQFLIKLPKRDNIKVLVSDGSSLFRRMNFISTKKMKQILNKIEL